MRTVKRILGHTFRNRKILQLALTHPSVSLEDSYERLEFLGDLVLDFVVGTHLFRKHPKENEAFLTNLKSSYVNSNFLHAVGEELGLQKLIHYQGHTVPKLDNFLEAFIGALYLDAGLEKTATFIRKKILSKKVSPLIDYKNLLVTFARNRFGSGVEYKIVKVTGPEHRKVFEVKVKIPGRKRVGRGKAGSRRQAEAAAAQDLLHKLHKVTPGP